MFNLSGWPLKGRNYWAKNCITAMNCSTTFFQCQDSEFKQGFY